MPEMVKSWSYDKVKRILADLTKKVNSNEIEMKVLEEAGKIHELPALEARKTLLVEKVVILEYELLRHY